MEPDDRRTAYHEAGHAVVAHALGMAVDYVELQEFGGVTRIPNPPDDAPFDGDYQRIRATQLIAGYVAEEIKMGDNDPGQERRDAIQRFMLKWPDGNGSYSEADAVAMVDALEVVARNILTRNWSVVKDLAETLIQDRRLDGDQLRSILTTIAE